MQILSNVCAFYTHNIETLTMRLLKCLAGIILFTIPSTHVYFCPYAWHLLCPSSYLCSGLSYAHPLPAMLVFRIWQPIAAGNWV